MAVFPRIQSPCPYQDNLAAIMEGDVCRMCKRQVFDLTAMSDDQRVDFLSACTGEVCVSYRLPVQIAVAAALATAAVSAPMAAAAQDAATLADLVVVAGGIKDPANVKFVEAADSKAAALPTVYEDAPPPTVATSAKAAAAPAKASTPQAAHNAT
ncbi:hypothetical protein ACO2Q3_10860 [Caulobacter sp. KR2-114]|uniref:hypothetical protein n=1 Tax=Caulobacter sp. KR2-114 TaxID=3400912 RepID=UPI003BFEE730